MTTIQGLITDYDGEILTIEALFPLKYLIEKQGVKDCEIRLNDSRHISTDQRKKIYATLRDISLWTGYCPDEVKDVMKYDFISKTGAEYFSLSNVDMTTAREFLTHLIDFCIEHGVPTDESLIERAPDVGRYIYKCLVEKKCCLSGQKAELHHLDAVGSGRNRKDIIHLGMEVLPLSRKYHEECHRIGKKTFCEKYHVFGIRMDKELCGIWKVKHD